MQTIPFLRLFRFADRLDVFMVIVGIIFALVHGALTPLFPILMGGFIDAFDPEKFVLSFLNFFLSFFLILLLEFIYFSPPG